MTLWLALTVNAMRSCLFNAT